MGHGKRRFLGHQPLYLRPLRQRVAMPGAAIFIGDEPAEAEDGEHSEACAEA